MNRQRARHLKRMSPEALVDFELSSVLPPGFSLRIEAVDHDQVHDLLVYVEVPDGVLAHQLATLPVDVRTCLARLAQKNPDDRCLANWSATFQRAGERLGAISVMDRARRGR